MSGHGHVVDKLAISQDGVVPGVAGEIGPHFARQSPRRSVRAAARPRRSLAYCSMLSTICAYPVQRQRCGLRAVAISSREGSGFLSHSPTARIAMPGMQKPHCTPPQRTKDSAICWRWSSSRPSSVVIDLPSALPASSAHERTGLPSTDRAAAALGLGLAAVLGRGDPQIVSQHIQQRQLVVGRQAELRPRPVDLADEFLEKWSVTVATGVGLLKNGCCWTTEVLQSAVGIPPGVKLCLGLQWPTHARRSAGLSFHRSPVWHRSRFCDKQNAVWSAFTRLRRSGRLLRL